MRRHSALPSVDSSPVVSPAGDMGPPTTPCGNRSQHRNRKRTNTDRNPSARKRLISTSSSNSNEIMDEVTNLLKSSDRLDRMMRSDDAISRILSHIRSDSDGESTASDKTLAGLSNSLYSSILYIWFLPISRLRVYEYVL